MKTVITYGTFDLLHQGHLNLLKRAKKLGDYLIVGVTTDSFDVNRGKLNVQQSVMDRVKAIQDTGLADKIILEEYEGQKVDDVKKYQVDVFAIGSDWYGDFDYLKEYCEVVYLERTKGISSTQIREKQQFIKLGIIGQGTMVDKLIEESRYVSGIMVQDVCDTKDMVSMEMLMESCDAMYILAEPSKRYQIIKKALEKNCHVICESPATLKKAETQELYQYAYEHHLVLFDAIKTAYLRAYCRMISLVKGGGIGAVKAIDVTCTSMKPSNAWFYEKEAKGGSFSDWGSFILLPIFQLFGMDYKKSSFSSFIDEQKETDLFTQLQLIYDGGVANGKVGYGVKSEGSLVISGTKRYVYVPSPWWKMEYFEVRFEDFNRNKRYFYQVEGEGIRYEVAEFLRLIRTHHKNYSVDNTLSIGISEMMEKFFYLDKERINRI